MGPMDDQSAFVQFSALGIGRPFLECIAGDAKLTPTWPAKSSTQG
jgi:hypothetical protein